MGIIKSASASSTWRGLDYYRQNKVISCKKLNEFEYEGILEGSNNKNYKVIMNVERPRSSSCNCPHANGKRIVCKHIVALYFYVFPNEAKKFEEAARKAEEEYQKYQEQLYDRVENCINSMSKKELQEALMYILNTAPDWVYEIFVKDYVER